MKTYTEKEIKEYFEYLQKVFPNCRFNEAVWQVQDTMFGRDSVYTIEKITKKLNEG